MANKIKQNLTYVFCAGMGLLTYILLAIPYVASFVKYDLGALGGEQSSSVGISGYNVMNLWGSGFSGVMSSILQIFVLLLGIALLAYGVFGLLKTFGVVNKFPEKLGKLETKKLGEIGLFVFAGLNVLLLVFLIILCVTHTQSASEFGYPASSGIRMSAGVFITLIFSVGAIVALKILQKKFPANATEESPSTYVCSKCGKKAKAKNKFCNECGGEVVKRTENTQSEGTKTETSDASIEAAQPKK